MLMPLAIRARSFGHDEPGGVQKLHRVPTSRLGGLIVVLACLAAQAVARDTKSIGPSLPMHGTRT